ncbi:D-alanine--D-alanine ligase family protein [Prochlorococcus sp. MIT 1341]|uniref:D-alanine--D-alanine ligase family protein n=1 Tax=Prochlorococcus sp. MIT 1341 TaxID=3096221 RepID=UPI002A75A453|nr:D-alanine--D-alanine ligase family protein [Prochlorococcus sp. MIT 1341]
MHTSFTSIGVVFGGASGEHDVSIQSAVTVIKALRSGRNANRYKVIPVYIDQQGCWHENTISNEILSSGNYLKIPHKPKSPSDIGLTQLPNQTSDIDIWFPVLHGPNGEDGTIQGLFTLMKKPYVGSNVLGSALGMDKLAMKTAFTAAGLPQVNYLGVNAKDLNNQELLMEVIRRIEKQLIYPYFVKPANLGSSVGISKVQDQKELIKGLIEASNYDNRLVIEEGIKAKELECGVLGKNNLKASMVGEIKYSAEWYNYEVKYLSNSSQIIIPANIEQTLVDEIQKLSIEACNALGVNSLARVDFFYEEKNQKLFLNEVNTLPGFTSQSMYPRLWEASGVTLEELVSKLVETATE